MAQRRQALIKVFLDSSVLFTAVNSPFGGSSKLFTLKNLKLLTSTLVLTEVERNVRKKLQKFHLERFFMLVSQISIFNEQPEKRLVEAARKVIAEKDATILARAKQVKSDVLVTLDKKGFLTEKTGQYFKPQKILTPKMLHYILENE